MNGQSRYGIAHFQNKQKYKSGFEVMKPMKQYIVDAFTDKVFHGNQAAICVLNQWLPEETMMNITKENNFSETAFTVKEGDTYHLRWFTLGGEIDLCGHATLACAYVLLNFYIPQMHKVVFSTSSGELIVTKKGEMLEMEFPAYRLKKVDVSQEMAEAVGSTPKEAYLAEICFVFMMMKLLFVTFHLIWKRY